MMSAGATGSMTYAAIKPALSKKLMPLALISTVGSAVTALLSDAPTRKQLTGH